MSETAMTPRVREILSWYGAENPGVLTNLRRLLDQGNLAGTGKLVILPVDQGFEHGPVRSFAVNPPGYDPLYHFELALQSGCNGYAAPLGALQAGAAQYAGKVPLILKLNNSDLLYKTNNPIPAVTGSIKDALQLGCVGIGFTIYPGTSHRKQNYQEIQELTAEARANGLVVVVWSYPRGENLSKNGETAVDVCAYAAHIAAQLGAHIIKVKPPMAHVELEDNKKAYDKMKVKLDTLADRTRHVVQAAFNGRRVLIFSGGETKDDTSLLNDAREMAAGGAFGAIVGRNSFQRPWEESIKLLKAIQQVYRDAK